MKTVTLKVWNDSTQSYEVVGERSVPDGTKIKKGTRVKDTGTQLLVASCGGGRPATGVTSNEVKLG